MVLERVFPLGRAAGTYDPVFLGVKEAPVDPANLTALRYDLVYLLHSLPLVCQLYFFLVHRPRAPPHRVLLVPGEIGENLGAPDPANPTFLDVINDEQRHLSPEFN